MLDFFSKITTAISVFIVFINVKLYSFIDVKLSTPYISVRIMIFLLSGHAVFKCQCKTLISSIDNIISTNFLTSEGAGALVDKIFNADFCAIQKVENHFIQKAICIKCRRKIGHSIEMSLTNPKLKGKILLNMSNLKMTRGV